MTGNPSHRARIMGELLDLAECRALTSRSLAQRSGISERTARRWIEANSDVLLAVGVEETGTTGRDLNIYGMRPCTSAR